MDELDLIKYSTAIELLEKIKLLVNEADSIKVVGLVQTFTKKVNSYKKTVPNIVRPTKAETARIKEGWKKTIKIKYLIPIHDEMQKGIGEEPYPDNFDESSLNRDELQKYDDDRKKYYEKEIEIDRIYEKIKDETYEIFESTISTELLNRRILLSRTIKENGESPETRFLINEINEKALKVFEEKNKQFIDDKLLGVYKKISIM